MSPISAAGVGGHDARAREGAQWGQAASPVRRVRSMRPSGGQVHFQSRHGDPEVPMLFRNKLVNPWEYGKTPKKNRYAHDALDFSSGGGADAI